MAHELSTPTTASVAGGSYPVAQAAQLGASSGNSWGGSSTLANSSMASTSSLSPSALQTNNNSYLMPTSPPKSRRGSNDGYRPAVKRSTGNPPACLVNASVTYCGNNQIYAFGGFDQYTDEVYNHVLRLDLTTLRWNLVDNYGDIPGVRMGHTASLYQGNKLIVFGGENEHREYLSDVVILDITTSTWASPEIRGPIPRGRARHASVIYEDKLFVIGGITGGITGETNVILDDLCYLDLKTWTWSRWWSFVARFDHTAWIWGGRLWVFGGLGSDMERGTDLWWLDLKGSPSLGISSSQGTVESPGTLVRMAQSPGAQYSPPPALQGRPGGYAANSASVQVRTLSRRKLLTAPGAISSLKFHSGPHVPTTLLSGTHFHVFSSGVLLDIATPSETVRPWDCNLASLELDSLKWHRLADGPEIFKSGYRWHYCCLNEDGTRAWLLGCSLEAPNATGAGDENRLNQVLPINLERYGLLGNHLTFENSEQARLLSSERQEAPRCSGLGADLVAVFDQPPESGSGTDFIITADRDDDPHHTELGDSESSVSSSHVQSTYLRDPRIRGPHFQASLLWLKWHEYHTKKKHIPEPYSVVRAFLYYLYTDSIAGHPEYCSEITEVAGMLVMANLYDMPKLRLLCVNRLSRELDVDNAAIVWERAGRTNEGWLKRRAASFCLANWGRVVRTEGFRTLSRQSLMELCEVVDMEGRVVPGHELELVGELDGFGSGADSKQIRTSTGGASGPGMEDLDEGDGDEDDGMELS
ncbi:kelch repeat protein [Histoplasma capsulatum G186AR]|uniref:Kelch repeat protein n=1 Tax=Ajellomyces capsulatus (strain G186AR / H82 / ATCC MYA-2454 / RMSCC 2432) TaxID=447093 RepID=C0NEZ4_AJECG|nr:kelch repeat protein [Histoplasma capsulatum G186AR]EEH09815.1 kelch repeat protein [Histoplasma capsulatum G186AR]